MHERHRCRCRTNEDRSHDDGSSTGETTSGDFEPEQKRYLEGFVAGLQIAKTAKGIAAPAADASPAPNEAIGPDAAARKAQDRVLAAGGKLSDPEKFKRDEHPFDAYERLKAHAAKNEYPKPPDNFRWRYFGLFYVAPNQNSYMCRLRMPNGILKAAQLAGLADLARAIWRRLRPCHDARQYPDPRDRGEERGRHDRGDPGSRPVLTRLRRRQYPQRHRHSDRRHRPAGTDRHAPLCARMALPHSQRPLALRPAAQVQCRFRRRAASSRCWKTPTTSASRRCR